MKKTLFRYGGYAVLIMLALMLATSLLLRTGENQDFTASEIIGYAGIVLATSFAYFGIRYYRDNVMGGSISFGQAMKVGLLIILFPSLAFGLFNVIYVKWIDPRFMDNYYNYQVDQLRAKLPAAEFAQKAAEMEAQRDWFMNPSIQFFAMFFTVFIIGLIITIISALVLKRKRQSPAFTS